MPSIKPALSYNPTDELWIISAFYNSNSYVTKPVNYRRFAERIDAAGLNFLMVECAFGDQPFTFKKSKNILQLRTSDVMWQKERLLNIALENLPAKCKKFVWIDCDVLFENPDWAIETANQLKHYKIVQPFKEAIRLPKDSMYFNGDGERFYSFAYVLKNNPHIVTEGRFDLHGHTGFAWASHTAIFKKNGLYDACIAGTADHVMAHAFAGDWNTGCVGRVFGNNEPFLLHYRKWSRKVYRSVQSKISYVEGTLLHLWHGDSKDREYTAREKMLIRNNFDPERDITLDSNKCWNWSTDNQELKQWAREYFVLRKEDN